MAQPKSPRESGNQRQGQTNDDKRQWQNPDQERGRQGQEDPNSDSNRSMRREQHGGQSQGGRASVDDVEQGSER